MSGDELVREETTMKSSYKINRPSGAGLDERFSGGLELDERSSGLDEISKFLQVTDEVLRQAEAPRIVQEPKLVEEPTIFIDLYDYGAKAKLGT